MADGVASWGDVGQHDIWIAGRTIGTTGTAFFTPLTIPGTAAGIGTEAGNLHQSGGASPKASSAAAQIDEVLISFRPAIARLDTEHIDELVHTQRQGLPSIWIPYPWVESWAIRSTVRNTWTLAGSISGSAGSRGLHIVPKVNVRDAGGEVVATTVPADHPGAATLTIVPGSPASDTEIQIPTTTDTTALVTGDLTVYAGGSLVVRYFGTVEAEIANLVHTFEEVNNLIQEFEIVVKRPQKDYEADV